MENGFYAMYYTGQHGSGLGLLAFVSGVVVGVDVTGGRFDGSYKVDDSSGSLVGSVQMTVPANSALVTGQPAQSEQYTVALPVSLPSNFADGEVMQLDLPIGNLNIRFEKLREFPKI